MKRAVLLLVVSLAAVAAPPAQAADESQSPRILAPAMAAFEKGDWPAVVEYAEILTAENPTMGRFWYALGYAYYAQEEYAKSVAAYARAVELGFNKGGCLYNMACSYALMGEADKALDAVEESIRWGLRNRENLLREDTDLELIRGTDVWHARILPEVREDATREDAWRTDLAYLHKRMEETHYDLYANISREEWKRTLDGLAARVGELEDHEIIVELMALFAKIGDGHTGVVPPLGEDGWSVIPIQPYIYSDGVFVRAASGDYADLVGMRIVRIEDTPVDDALARVATVTQRDNPQQIKWISPRYMTVVEILRGLGIADDADAVNVTLADASGKERTVAIQSVPFTIDIIRGQYENMVTMHDAATGEAPLYRKAADRPNDHYWFEHVPGQRLVYFYFDSVRNKEEGESLADFSHRLFQFVDANPVDALVIDVRFNHGGNNYLTVPVINDVIRSDKIGEYGTLFVITGRETFSACQNFVNRLEQQVDPIFVGEPTGSSPNFVGEDNKIMLPYSELVVRGSSRYWQDTRSDDYRIWIAPHLMAELSSEDVRTNRDPAMEAILAFLEANRGDGASVGAGGR